MASKNNSDEVYSRIEKKIEDARLNVFKKSRLKKIADFAANLIKKRTRLGYGSEDRKKGKLKKLSESYKQQRAGKVAFARGKYGQTYSYKPEEKPKLSTATTPAKSNLTNSGQMLDSIKGRSPADGYIQIYMDSKRNDGLTNQEVREFSEKDRPFFELTEAERKQISREVREELRIEFKKSLG